MHLGSVAKSLVGAQRSGLQVCTKLNAMTGVKCGLGAWSSRL